MKNPWWMALMPLAAKVTRLLGRTLRCTYINHETEEALRRSRGIILAFWHGRLLYFGYHYRDQGIPMMLSRSTDGEAADRVSTALGFVSVRGSSSRGGATALREVIRFLKEGRDTGITPDGPRGPCYRVQPGIINLARISGVPIVPATFTARHRVVFKSWDHFILPLPFSRAVVIFGEPLEVGRDDDCEAARLTLEERLNAITRQADCFEFV